MSSSNDVFGTIGNFFKQLGGLNTADQVNAFFQQYWYVWLIISIGVALLVAINVLICYYFRHHTKLNEVDEKTGKRKLHDKDWGIPEPQQTLFIPIEQNKQEAMNNPAGIDEYDDSKFAIEALMAHNQCRLQHGAAPLQSNDYLNQAATGWATELARMNRMQHSPDQWRRYQGFVLGENLAYFVGPVLKGDRLTDIWYHEGKKHDFNADLQENSLHFSQLIWKSTREVGFGRCQVKDTKQWYGVALYNPPGNFPAQYHENVRARSDLEDGRLA